MHRMLARLDIGLSAALVTWAVVAAIALNFAGSIAEPKVQLAIAAFVLNLIAMLAAGATTAVPGGLRLAAFGLQLTCAFILGALLQLDFLQILTIIWIAMAPALLGTRRATVALILIVIAWVLQMHFVWDKDRAVVSALLFATFHLFALLMALATMRAEAATTIAEARNRELKATQHLLAQAAAQSERSRIARDLHDLLGHHLTALTINLQVAARQSDGEQKARIEQCHGLAKLLLADVREAVSALRDSDRIDLAAAVGLMAGEVPGLTIEADIDPDLEIDDVRTAEALLRCIQEALTNTLRHAGATVFRIRLARRNEQIELAMSDDGQAAAMPREGNGLTGMRERIDELRGRFDLARRDRAIHISITVPAA